jgi:GT2 family glycosyltransferase
VANLSIAIVTYQPDISMLSRCLQSLRIASDFAVQSAQLSDVELMIIDNSTDPMIQNKLQELVHATWNRPQNKANLLITETNLGYGKAHNLAISQLGSDYHLVLNPDVLLDKESLGNSLRFMNGYPDVALLTPYVINDSGNKEYLNKRYPGLLTLLIRGFAPSSLRERFRGKIAYYEMRDRDPDKVDHEIPLASGCFMFFRASVLKKLGGFSDKFFLYFEDYDLSIRTHEYGEIAYVPGVKVTHFGGGAARKGLWHVFLFIRSSITFFKLHGWRLW